MAVVNPDACARRRLLVPRAYASLRPFGSIVRGIKHRLIVAKALLWKTVLRVARGDFCLAAILGYVLPSYLLNCTETATRRIHELEERTQVGYARRSSLRCLSHLPTGQGSNDAGSLRAGRRNSLTTKYPTSKCQTIARQRGRTSSASMPHESGLRAAPPRSPSSKGFGGGSRFGRLTSTS